MQGLLAGVANVDLFDLGTNELIASNKSLVDSGINLGITGEEARGGQGNVLLGKYYHTSSFGLTLTNQIWNLEYLALNAGGAISATSDIMTTEQVTVASGAGLGDGVITVTQTPKDFTPTSGTIGWVKKATDDDTGYKKIMFTEKTATVVGFPVNTIVCVKYVVNSASARKFTVNADYIPSVVHAVMTIGLHRAGTTKETLTSSSKIGNIIIDIPNFQLEGTQNLGLTSSSIATISLSGSALATFSGGSGCSDQGYYATITEDIFGLDEFSRVETIVVANSDIDLSVPQTEKIEVYAMYSDGTVPRLLDNSKLTFTSETAGTATVGANTGIVTAVATGTSVISVLVTGKANLEAKAVVTVS